MHTRTPENICALYDAQTPLPSTFCPPSGDDVLPLGTLEAHEHVATLRRLVDDIALVVAEMSAVTPPSAAAALRDVRTTANLARHGLRIVLRAYEAAFPSLEGVQLALWHEVQP